MIFDRPLRPGRRRRLTTAERALAAALFGPALDGAVVRILAVPLWPRAFVAGRRLIGWPARSAGQDFADPAAPLALQAMFVHELTHVWQAQAGVNLLLGKLRAGDGPAAYAYGLDRATRFEALNIEQQAMVVEHAFRLSRGGVAPFASDAYAAALAGPVPPLAALLRAGARG